MQHLQRVRKRKQRLTAESNGGSMMRILYIAYSCSPVNGSEDAIGWHIPVASAREHTVYVITKEEQRQYIESYAKPENIRFFYVDIPEIYKRMFKGPLYSGRLNIWNRKAQKMAEEICRSEHIDLIHQITPVEFRSIGNYGRIPGVKFVCGPLGGGESIPKGLRSYAVSHRAMEAGRSLLNRYYRLVYRIFGKLDNCRYLWFANRETRAYLLGDSEREHVALYPEIGISRSALQDRAETCKREKFRFLVVGRLVYRKGHALLLDALRQIPLDLEWECLIAGKGPEEKRLRQISADYGFSERVRFCGEIPYIQMEELYESADVLVVPSLRETTGTVILEAMAKGLPVVTIKQFGGAVILDNDSGWLYDGHTKEEYTQNLSQALTCCITQPEETVRRGENAAKVAGRYTWEEKMRYYELVYRSII